MNQTHFNFPPASRNSDPISSHLAEQEITRSGARNTHCEYVLQLVKERPLHTALELETRQQIKLLDRHQIQKRLSDLEGDKMGRKVKKGPKRECRISGKLAVTWEAR